MLPFCLCSKEILAIRHMNRPLFPTTLSIPPYDIGKYVELRTCQHPTVAKMDQGRSLEKAFERKPEGSRRKEDLDVDDLKICRRICGSKDMVTECSRQARIGVRS